MTPYWLEYKHLVLLDIMLTQRRRLVSGMTIIIIPGPYLLVSEGNLLRLADMRYSDDRRRQ